MIKRSTVPRLLKFSYGKTVYHFRQYAGKNIYLYKSMTYLRIQYPVNNISVWLLGRNSKQRKRCELRWEREGGRRGVGRSEGQEWVRKRRHKWGWGREEEEGGGVSEGQEWRKDWTAGEGGWRTSKTGRLMNEEQCKREWHIYYLYVATMQYRFQSSICNIKNL